MNQRLAITVGLSALVLLSGPPSGAEEPVLTLAPGVPTLVVVPSSTPLGVDGVADEAAWAGAPRLVLALTAAAGRAARRATRRRAAWRSPRWRPRRGAS